MQLGGKVIIITCDALGIGKGIVKVLANEGAIPIIIGRKKEDNINALREIELKEEDRVFN